MLAVRENEIAAESMGVNAFKYKMTAFVIGAFLLDLLVDYTLIIWDIFNLLPLILLNQLIT